MGNRYAIVRHNINDSSREPFSLSAPDINQAFGIAAQMDAICNLDGAIDRINSDCHQITPKFDFWRQSLNKEFQFDSDDDYGLFAKDGSLEGYCFRLDDEQANHIATLGAIRSNAPWSDVDTFTTDWGLDDDGNDRSESDFEIQW